MSAGIVIIMTRPPITPERMLGDASTAQLIFRSDIVHLRHQANFRVFDPLDFLAEGSAHIPDAHEKTTLSPTYLDNTWPLAYAACRRRR
jgi:hypothetical protein